MMSEDLSKTLEVRRVQCGQGEWTTEGLNKSKDAVVAALQRFEEHLSLRTYFVSNNVTLADLYFTALMAANRSALLELSVMKDLPNVQRHMSYMTSPSFFQAVMGRNFGAS